MRAVLTQSRSGAGAPGRPRRPDPPGRLLRAARGRAGVAAAVLVLAAGGGVAGALAASGPHAGIVRSRSALSATVTSPSLATFHRAMIGWLRAHAYDPRWVVCVASGARFEGVRVVRCNVDFGDPHIQAYCSVFRGGRLLTSAQDPAIPCGHDNAGWSATIQSSS